MLISDVPLGSLGWARMSRPPAFLIRLRSLFKRQGILGDIAPDEVFIEGFLSASDDAFCNEIICDMRPA